MKLLTEPDGGHNFMLVFQGLIVRNCFQLPCMYQLEVVLQVNVNFKNDHDWPPKIDISLHKYRRFVQQSDIRDAKF